MPMVGHAHIHMAMLDIVTIEITSIRRIATLLFITAMENHARMIITTIIILITMIILMVVETIIES